MILFRTVNPAAQSPLLARSGSGRSRLFMVAATILMIASVLATGTAQAQYQQCINYRVVTRWGRVEVDTRPVGNDYIGAIAWAMFITNLTDVPGRYDYQILVNGKPMYTNTVYKDDNLHITIPRYQQGHFVYEPGDEIQVIASHPAGKNLYVTPINRCAVPHPAG
ncbi:hypothetical protein [Nocardia alni]|uniref:hypothetical protein n=1 Tax=Nocardia alni TaxID=2815723 RepID=UPI001C241084|nr:hypothetical protein [Nocardia alni]